MKLKGQIKKVQKVAKAQKKDTMKWKDIQHNSNIRQFINFITMTTENWKVEFAAEPQTFAEVEIQGGIFQRGPFLLLLFVIAMTTLYYKLRKCTKGLQNHLRRSTTLCAKMLSRYLPKWGRTKDPNTNNKNMQSRYRNGI